DEIWDMMGGSPGTYDSWPSRHIKGEIDLNFRFKANRVRDFQKREQALARGLTDDDFEKIGVKMVIARVGRERLEASGVSPELITKIDLAPYTPAQQAYVDAMQKDFALSGPQVAEMARKLYQKQVEIDPNYFPLEMDWAARKQQLDYTSKSGLAEG